MRSLHESDTPAAAEAIESFVWRAAREIGALAASLGGVDGWCSPPALARTIR
jgi:acetate kinase